MSHSVADIIDLAINRHLWGGEDDRWEPGEYEFSCSALGMACKYNARNRRKVEEFLLPMGIVFHGIREQFDGIPRGPKRQYARALWLTWAAMIAREEGI